MPKIVFILLLLLANTPLFPQSGSTIKEFEKKLSDYYDAELIEDVISTIGDNQSRVWSWDIGDYSSDDHNDIACVVRYSKEKSRQCSVFFFVDINGTLTPVGSQSRDFVDSPLEVGVAIKNSSCYVTSKKEQFNWNIVGYKYRHGSFFESDTFSTSRIGNQTSESFKDHVQRRNSLHVFSTKTEETSFYHHYYDIPSFSKGEIINSNHAGPYIIDRADDVAVGAFYWKGPADASIHIIESFYDEKAWYVRASIKDDTLIDKICDTCIQDKLTILLSNILPSQTPEQTLKKQVIAKQQSYMIEILPSFATPHESTILVQEQNSGYKKALSQASLNVKKRKSGYDIFLSIPFQVLSGLDISGLGMEQRLLGCSIILTDSDNQFRPEELTRIISSDYEMGNDDSLGVLTFYPKNAAIADVQSHFSKELSETLLQLGF
jgi:hypothetical protein